MIDRIREIIDLVGMSSDDIRFVLIVCGAVLVGIAASFYGTQLVKRKLGWSGRRCQAVAFLLGFAPAYTITPGWGWVPFWIAVAVGLAPPSVYKILVTTLGERWPWMKSLSGDRDA